MTTDNATIAPRIYTRLAVPDANIPGVWYEIGTLEWDGNEYIAAPEGHMDDLEQFIRIAKTCERPRVVIEDGTLGLSRPLEYLALYDGDTIRAVFRVVNRDHKGKRSSRHRLLSSNLGYVVAALIAGDRGVSSGQTV